MWLTRINVSSFRRVPSLNVVTNIKQGDNIYISQQKIADQSVLLAYVNITLWHGWWSYRGSNGTDVKGTTIEKAITLTKYLNNLRQTDIVVLQNKNPDGSALTTIIQQGNTLLQQANFLIAPLTTYIQQQQGQLNLCLGQKKQADDNYNIALQSYNSALVEKATVQAQQASSCISTSSVAMNSAKGILANLQSEIVRTQKYIWLITNNKSLLMQYGSIIGTEVPLQLVDLQQQIQKL